MHTGTAGKCDTCDAGIPCGAPFRVRHMTPEAVDDAFADAEPATRVSGATTAEGLARRAVHESDASVCCRQV